MIHSKAIREAERSVVSNDLGSFDFVIWQAAHMGMCTGLRRIMRRTHRALDDEGTVAIFGDFVHNPLVYGELASRGASRVDHLSEIVPGQSVVIGPHGNTPEVLQGIALSGGNLLDVSCPKVNRVIDAAVRFCRQGYTIVFVGKPGHEESRIIRSRVKRLFEVHRLDDINELPIDEPLAFVAQSTEMVERFSSFVQAAFATGRSVVVEDTICTETRLRQDAVRQLSQSVDLMIIVGGAESYNTNALRLASEPVCDAVVVESGCNISSDLLAGVKSVGVTAGASTPDAAVQDVLRRLEALGGKIRVG